MDRPFTWLDRTRHDCNPRHLHTWLHPPSVDQVCFHLLPKALRQYAKLKRRLEGPTAALHWEITSLHQNVRFIDLTALSATAMATTNSMVTLSTRTMLPLTQTPPKLALITGAAPAYHMTSTTLKASSGLLTAPSKVLAVPGPGMSSKAQSSGSFCDDNGMQHKFRIPNSYYIPDGQLRLLSPQHWAKTQSGGLQPHGPAMTILGHGARAGETYHVQMVHPLLESQAQPPHRSTGSPWTMLPPSIWHLVFAALLYFVSGRRLITPIPWITLSLLALHSSATTRRRRRT